MKLLILFIFNFFLSVTQAQAQSAEEIIKKIDYNQSPEQVVYRGKMRIVKGNKTQEKELKIFGSGKTKTFVEFYSPPRDKGTKYLRLDNNLWIYLPSAEKTVKISGHQLREGMGGSDFSYEDQTERTQLFDTYDYKILGEEEVLGKKNFVIQLDAKPGREITYYKRKLWVDKEQFIVTRSEMYAKSGKLIKVYSVSEVKKVGDRFYPTHFKMEDKIKENSFSELSLSEIEIDKTIPQDVFTLKNIEKKN